MSTKLTNYMREGIAKRILIHRFSDQIKALEADLQEFAEQVYNDLYRRSDREKMAALPAGWLPENSGIGVQFGEGSGYTKLLFDGRVYGSLRKARAEDKKEATQDTSRRMLSKHSHGCAKVYEAAHRLSSRYYELQERQKTLTAAYEAASKQVGVALNAATTINRLVEMWPEVEPFVRHLDSAPLKVPAIPTTELNAMLDLPVAA